MFNISPKHTLTSRHILLPKSIRKVVTLTPPSQASNMARHEVSSQVTRPNRPVSSAVQVYDHDLISCVCDVERGHQRSCRNNDTGAARCEYYRGKSGANQSYRVNERN